MPPGSHNLNFLEENILMITVNQAKDLIYSHSHPLPPRRLPLVQAGGKVLAEDAFSKGDFPPFLQSSMDGYAFRMEDLALQKPLRVEGEMAAGVKAPRILAPGTAARIFTGAPLPEGADTVVMQEKCQIEEGKGNDRFVTIEDTEIHLGMNTRPKGAEIKSGEKALPKGILLTPAALGYLAGIGISEVEVIPHPRITLIITGSELQQPGRPLEFGQVYESNSLTLAAALKEFHFEELMIRSTGDDLEAVTRELSEALEQSDLVMLSGGISVGSYDYVLEATRRTGVSQWFHKVKQRPGKPLFFGGKGSTLIFGLPGNPSSVLTCFYEYVLPALGGLTQNPLSLEVRRVPLLKAFSKKARLTHFLKGVYDGRTVEVLGAQESFRLSSYARAGCLVRIEEETMEVPQGSEVEIHLLPRY